MSTKKSPIPALAKGTLPLDGKAPPEKVVTVVTAQLANVQACADYPNQPTVQATAITLKGSLGNLVGILASLANARALVSSLETQRDTECVVVRRDQAALGAAVEHRQPGRAEGACGVGCHAADALGRRRARRTRPSR